MYRERDRMGEREREKRERYGAGNCALHSTATASETVARVKDREQRRRRCENGDPKAPQSAAITLSSTPPPSVARWKYSPRVCP